MTHPPQEPGPTGRGDRALGGPQDQQQPQWYGNKHASLPLPNGGQPIPAPPPAAGTPGPVAQQPHPQGSQPPQAPADWQPPPPPDWSGAGGAARHHQHEQLSVDDLAPTRRRSRWPWVLGGIVLLAAGVVAGYLLWFTGPGSPRPVARRVVAEVNAGNLGGLSPHLCAAKRATLTRALAQLERAEFDIDLGRVSTRGETATAELEGTYSLGGASKPVDQTIGLIVENGQWKVCDLAT